MQNESFSPHFFFFKLSHVNRVTFALVYFSLEHLRANFLCAMQFVCASGL